MPVINPHPIYFRQAVASILNQTLHDLELIIVEEPSVSSGSELLADVQDGRLRHLVHPQRTSLVRQRNRGLVEARAELIAWLDADDVAEPDRLQQQVAFMEEHPDVAVLGSQLAIIDHEGKLIGRRSYPCDHEAIVRTLRRCNPLAQPAVLCRKAALLAVGGYQYSKHPATEDYELWCRLAEQGFRFANHCQTLLKYRVHPGGAKAVKLRGILHGTLEIKRRFFAGKMNLGDLLRLWGERFLLWLPPGWVYRLFMKMNCQPASGAASAPREGSGNEGVSGR
jgi:glycosyltransferase involved in cell wall biosynthesis